MEMAGRINTFSKDLTDGSVEALHEKTDTKEVTLLKMSVKEQFESD